MTNQWAVRAAEAALERIKGVLERLTTGGDGPLERRSE